EEGGLTELATIPDTIVDADGVLILGGGVAGLFAALKLAPIPSLIVTGVRAGHAGSSVSAHGGLAAALGAGDTWENHLKDRIGAGAGLCDADRAELLAREGPDRVEDVIRLGTPFDREASGKLALGLEAGHGRPRIVHVAG